MPGRRRRGRRRSPPRAAGRAGRRPGRARRARRGARVRLRGRSPRSPDGSPAGRRATPRSSSGRPVRGLLTAERTALNLLCHLSGVATATAAWVDAVAGTGARDPGHPQDAARAAAAGEVRRALRRRGQPPHGPRRRGADQGQPRRRGRVGRRGAGRGRARPRPTCRARSRSTPSTSSTRCWPWTPSWCCWTTSPRPTTAEAVRRRGDRATLLESSGGLVLANAARVRRDRRRLHLRRRADALGHGAGPGAGPDARPRLTGPALGRTAQRRHGGPGGVTSAQRTTSCPQIAGQCPARAARAAP